MEKIYSIPLNFNEMFDELNSMKDKYELSLGVKDILKNGKLKYNDPYKKYENDRWVVILNFEENLTYIIVRPYEVHCSNYLERSKK